MATEIRAFDDFWPLYVAAHRAVGNRACHYAGTAAGIAVFAWALWSWQPLLLPVALVVAYGAAWFGHFVIEGNRPATFGHPFYSLAADFKMLWLGATGRMAAEVERLAPVPSGAASR